jgi:hypothetical protein
MRSKTLVLSAVLALTVAAVTTRPATSDAAASATPAPRPTFTIAPGGVWALADCATGEIGPVATDPSGRVLVPATIAVCSPWSAALRFTMVAYRPTWPTVLALASQLRPYAQSGSTSVTGALALDPGIAPTIGVCLVRNLPDRVACVRLDTGPDHRTVTTPIPVDDPLVSRTAVFVNDAAMPPSPDPFCGTCLTFPA